MTKLIGVSAALLLFVCTADASAAQGVKRIGVQGGFAGVSGEGSFAGYGGGLSAGYSFTDAWTLGISATASSNQITEAGPRGQVFVQSVGVSYALDILQIVPYFGVYAGLYELHGGALKNTEVKGGAQLALGVDWVYSRDFTFGLELRGHALPGDFLRSPDNPTPFYATTFLKAEYTWGWF
ncbi:MAG: outer membrane beta-barrel protein [Polyangiales bacterium]